METRPSRQYVQFRRQQSIHEIGLCLRVVGSNVVVVVVVIVIVIVVLGSSAEQEGGGRLVEEGSVRGHHG